MVLLRGYYPRRSVNSNQGFDGVYIKVKPLGCTPPGSSDCEVLDILIAESKSFQGSIALNAMKGSLPEQMTDDWVDNVLGRMLTGSSNVQDTRDIIRAYKLAEKKISKIVTAVDKANGQFNIINYGEVIRSL